MEFALHIITNGNRANISLEYDNPKNIDKEELKNAINKAVDCIIDATIKNDFKESNILLKDDNVENLKQPDYIKTTELPPKHNSDETIKGGIFMEEQDNSSIIVKNDNSYLSYIVVSQIKQNKSIA